MTLLEWLKLPKDQWKPAMAQAWAWRGKDLEVAIEIERQIRSLETALAEREAELAKMEAGLPGSWLKDRVTFLEKELAEAQKEKQVWMDGYFERNNEIVKLETTLTRLRDGIVKLRQYTIHHEGCEVEDGCPCDCGLDEILCDLEAKEALAEERP